MLFGAMNSPLRPVLDEVQAIAASDFDYLELTMDPPHAGPETIQRLKQEIRKTLKEHHLGLVCHLPTFVSTADLTERIRRASVDEVLACLEVAAEIEPMKIVLHPPYVVGLGAFVPELAKTRALESLEILIDKSAELGLRLCLENMFPRTQWLTNPEEFVDLLADFPALNLTLDIAHAYLGEMGEKKCLRFIEMFPDRIGHLHGSDNFGKEDLHLPIGAGIIDFPKVVKALKAAGYNDTMTLEVFSRDREYLKISKRKMAEMFERLD